MKFSEYVYERPNIDEVSNEVIAIADEIAIAKSKDEAVALIQKAEKITNHFQTMSTICSIRNSINTEDEFYKKEQEFFDENTPTYQNAVTKYAASLVNSPLRKELEGVYGSQWFKILELNLKSFDEKITDELIAESKLVTEYSKLLASAKIEFDGKINNLSQMTVYTNSSDRNIRLEATKKIAEFMSSIETKLDDIYDKLVHVRDKMAKKMGYDNYIPFGYIRLGRSDYDASMVKNYRDQVYETIVPIAKSIIENQKKRIGISDFKSYDIPLFYNDGNPMPHKDKDTLVKKAYEMYSDISPETKEFFKFMMDNELMDLETKPNKQGGGYCTVIADYKAPFIFSNFNGTMGDVDVLTHEAGHAFECYTATKNLPISDLYWPTLEACEIHSMSMEFFAHPYMDKFFDDDAAKYRFKHLAEAITFIPYGVCVDDFQHYVYANPNVTPAQRKAYWHEIEAKYTPWKDFDGISYYERGNWWQRQSHIFGTAFYYIDYTLAQVCAFQFLLLNHNNHKEAWETYYNLCKMGGSKSFTGLLQAINFKNSFESGALKCIMPGVCDILKVLENEYANLKK